jgi:hypothetical protein
LPESITNFTNSPIQKSDFGAIDSHSPAAPQKTAKPGNPFGECQVKCSRKIPLSKARLAPFDQSFCVFYRIVNLGLNLGNAPHF